MRPRKSQEYLATWALAVITALLGGERVAAACAVCSVGDPTLTTMGAEQPFRNRVRGAIGVQDRTDAIGQERVDRIKLREQRLDATLSWAPWSWLFLSATMPVLRREVTYVNLAKRVELGPGDLELRARAFVWRDREYGPHHLLALTGGVKLPTAPTAHGTSGERLPQELQPGTGSVDPIAGASYSFFAWPWSFYGSVQLTWPTMTVEGARSSRSVRGSAVGQWQATDWLGLRLGLDGRVDGRALEDGRPDRDSGGFIGYVSPELVFSPALDLTVAAVVRLPVVQQLEGFHREGRILGLTVARDF